MTINTCRASGESGSAYFQDVPSIYSSLDQIEINLVEYCQPEEMGYFFKIMGLTPLPFRLSFVEIVKMISPDAISLKSIKINYYVIYVVAHGIAKFISDTDIKNRRDSDNLMNSIKCSNGEFERNGWKEAFINLSKIHLNFYKRANKEEIKQPEKILETLLALHYEFDGLSKNTFSESLAKRANNLLTFDIYWLYRHMLDQSHNPIKERQSILNKYSNHGGRTGRSSIDNVLQFNDWILEKELASSGLHILIRDFKKFFEKFKEFKSFEFWARSFISAYRENEPNKLKDNVIGFEYPAIINHIKLLCLYTECLLREILGPLIGCDLLVVLSKPVDFKGNELRKKYVFIQDSQDLFYISSIGDAEKVSLTSLGIFEEKITGAGNNLEVRKYSLSGDQIKNAITLNGGHTPDLINNNSVGNIYSELNKKFGMKTSIFNLVNEETGKTNLRKTPLLDSFNHICALKKKSLSDKDHNLRRDMLLLLLFRNYTAHHYAFDHDFQHNESYRGTFLKPWIEACVSVPVFLADFVDQNRGTGHILGRIYGLEFSNP